MSESNKNLVLVVDDDTNTVVALKSLLQDQDYKTVSAQNGARAMELLDDIKPDLILLDVMMPKMNGYEFCQKVQSQPETKTIPIIFITGKSDREEMLKGLELGGVDYIIKPFNERELLARIQTQLKLKKAHEEIDHLRGLLPICIKCKKIRTNDGYWKKVENYLAEQWNDLKFSHALCDECFQEEYPEYYDKKESEELEDDIN